MSIETVDVDCQKLLLIYMPFCEKCQKHRQRLDKEWIVEFEFFEKTVPHGWNSLLLVRNTPNSNISKCGNSYPRVSINSTNVLVASCVNGNKEFR